MNAPGLKPLGVKMMSWSCPVGRQRDHEQPVEGKQGRKEEEDRRDVEHRTVHSLGVGDGVGDPLLERASIEFSLAGVLEDVRAAVGAARGPVRRLAAIGPAERWITWSIVPAVADTAATVRIGGISRIRHQYIPPSVSRKSST